MSKKSIPVLLCCLMALVLFACGSEQQTVPQSLGMSSDVQSEYETTAPESELDAPPVKEAQNETSQLPGQEPGDTEENAEMKMNVHIGAHTFTATLEDNAAVDALVKMMESGPLTLQMSEYAGFEKVGELGANLPASNSQTTTQAGDIVLYQGSQIVIFYGSNSWSYTRLGKIDDLTGWTDALGSGDVSVTFSLGE